MINFRRKGCVLRHVTSYTFWDIGLNNNNIPETMPDSDMVQWL